MSKPVFKCVFQPIPEDITPEDVCYAITGKTIDQMVEEIIENKDGKYDCLYE